jgi:transcriptional regulator with XRE-family HTH domain
MTNLERLRKQAQLTRYELQRDSGVSAANISYLEKNGANASSVTVRKLAHALCRYLPMSEQQIAVTLLGMEAEHEAVLS